MTHYRILKVPWLNDLQRYQAQTFARQAIVYDWETSRFWLDYEYPAFGKPENNPANWPSGSVASTGKTPGGNKPSLTAGKIDILNEWLPKASDTQEDPFKPKAEHEYDDKEKPPRDPKYYLSTIRVPQALEPEATPSQDAAIAGPSHSSIVKQADEVVPEQNTQQPQKWVVNEEWPSPETAMAWDSPLNVAMRKRQKEAKARESAQKSRAKLADKRATIPVKQEPQKWAINDEWPSPETAMAVDSPLNRKSGNKKDKGKAIEFTPLARPVVPTPTPTSAGPSTAGPPVGPVARLAALRLADLAAQAAAAQSNVPPPIEAPFMPITSEDSLDMKPKSSRHQGLRTLTKPKSLLNPLATPWEPSKAVSSAASKPLQTPLQPERKHQIQEEPLIDVSGDNTPVNTSQKGFRAMYDSLSGSPSSMPQNRANDDVFGDSPALVPSFPPLVARKGPKLSDPKLSDPKLSDPKLSDPKLSDKLIDYSDSEETVVEKKEEVSEADSRLFFEGSLLQAPPVQQMPLIDTGRKAVVDQILFASIEALDMLRAVRGQVTLQLDIGHILLPRVPFHKFPYKEGFNPGEWEDKMNPAKPWGMGRNIVFSKV